MEELTPITRREVFLAKASGQDVETTTPITREEVFLDEIAKGGGSSGGGVLVVHSTYEEWEDNGTWKWKETLDKTATELASADFVVLSNRPVPLETGS